LLSVVCPCGINGGTGWCRSFVDLEVNG
jgi:hypothetical protein